MAGGSTSEAKKAVCKSFTSVVKSSALPIDPKAFFMMLNTNFAVICHGGRIDLGPIWDALASGHRAEELFGLFLKFQEKGSELGLEVGLPPSVRGLSPEQRAHALAPWNGRSIPDEVSGAEPLPLDPDALTPVVTEEVRRRVIQTVVGAIRLSPLGGKLDMSQVSFVLDSHFDDLYTSEGFDFDRIFKGLRETESVEDRDFYEVILRTKKELGELGVAVKEPKLRLNTIEKRNVEEDVRRADQRAAKERAAALEPEAAKKEATKEEPRTRAHTREEKLAEFGLKGEEKKKLPIIRIAVLAVLLAGAGVVAYSNRPNRPLSTEEYAGVMPVKQAELRDGVFQCIIDQRAWFQLEPPERKKRIEAFGELLRQSGFAQDMQCRDTTGRLVLTFSGGGRIVGARFFVLGDIDGTIPANAPNEGKPKGL